MAEHERGLRRAMKSRLSTRRQHIGNAGCQLASSALSVQLIKGTLANQSQGSLDLLAFGDRRQPNFTA